MKEIDVKKGLNQQEVHDRIAKGLINISDQDTTKSYKQIIKDNLLTLFNLINVILAGLIIFTGSYRNLLFLGVVISNIIIGTFQEIRTKRVLDKISLIHSMKVSCIRDGREKQISVEEIVIDDILKLKMGNQIVSDSIVRQGSLEVDESLLTGESHTIIKNEGDFLYSGSFVTGGNAYVQTVHVGNDNYAAKMTKDAKKYSKYPSELRDMLNKIIKYIGIAIIPLGIILFSKQYFILNGTLKDSILNTSAALIGMIPEGLVILTSIALAVGVINLARHRTLVQELYCIETLARVDVLCLDKTGTITEGKMIVDSYHSENKHFKEIMKNMTHDLEDANATIDAIREYFIPEKSFECVKTLPFNSSKKYSGVIYRDAIYIMGAYSFIMNHPDKKQLKSVEDASAKGYRVISVAKTTPEDLELKHLEWIGDIYLLDKIREDARETLDYFKKQDVDIKIISGDHPLTVSQIAKRVHLEHYDSYIDASQLNDDEIEEAANKYHIFGRVTPKQKKALIAALKRQGHCVGMSGDGVNDVLAFKEADVSIAMASGSDVAKSSANLVLLDSNFDALPEVLYEGRRVINNIQRVATLFLTKTIFSILLAFITIILPFEYPFVPIHLTFVSSLTIGIPAFFMAIEPNRNRVEKKFLENVIKVSLPSAVSVILCIIYIYIIASIQGFSSEVITQLAVITIAINGCIVLTKVSHPFTLLRKIILVFVYIGIAGGLFWAHDIISMLPIRSMSILLDVGVIALILIAGSKFGSMLVEKIYERKK